MSLTGDGVSVYTAGEKYKRFPPGLGHLRVPVSSGRAAAAAISMHASCKPLSLRLQQCVYACAHALGAWVIPGRSEAWAPPMGHGLFQELAAEWQRELGRFDSVAVHQRIQPSRVGLMLLLCNRGVPVAFVKVRNGDSTSLEHEFRTLEKVHRFRPSTFSVPEPLAIGRVEDWCYFAATPLPLQVHRPPAAAPVPAILTEVERALGGLPRPAATPPHWRPMHGDFTPWNLRLLNGGAHVLYDWEDAAWAPPGADAVLFAATSNALEGGNAGPHPHSEAVGFWTSRVEARARGDARDQRLAAAVLRTLRRMSG